MNRKRIRLLILILAIFAASYDLGLVSKNTSGKTRRRDAQEVPWSPGQRVNVSNRYDLGSISITGWDRNTVQASASVEDGSLRVPVTVVVDPLDARRVLVSPAPANNNHSATRVHLEVKIPREADLEPVYVPKAELKVIDLKGAVDLKSESGTVIVQDVGSVKVQAKSGEIQITNVQGPVTLSTSSANVTTTGIRGGMIADIGAANVRVSDVTGPITLTATTGNIEVENAASDVRVVSINGRTNLRCVKGRADVSDTSGVITLTAIQGDVDVMTSGGRATFTGGLRDRGYYRLRTLSGAVNVAVPDDARDFTVTLSSYSGQIEVDALPGKIATQRAGKRRLVLDYGAGAAQIELDAFNGTVRFRRVNANSIEKCERYAR